ncbi:hypothetical protein BJX99DRAFT_263637 [Aspergillus californicus]
MLPTTQETVWYEIKLGVMYTPHPDIPAEYIIILHKNDKSTCHWYYTAKKPEWPRGTERHIIKQWNTNGLEHFRCYEMFARKDLVGYLHHKNLKTFVDIFYETEAKESGLFAFRCLFACVDRGFIDEDVVKSLQPEFNIKDNVKDAESQVLVTRKEIEYALG